MPRERRIQIDWNIIAVAISVVAIVVGWGVSVEIRMSQHSSIQTVETSVENVHGSVEALVIRVQNIEKLLTPLIVDWRVQKEVERVKKELNETVASPAPAPAPSLPKMSPKIVEPPKKDAVMEEAQQRAKRWANEEILRGQQSGNVFKK